jgi:tetratricopeptide (TPR) repeat protein
MSAGSLVYGLSAVLLVMIICPPALSTEAGWESLTAESFELYEAGLYGEAIAASRRALAAAEAEFGPDHQVTAKSMNNLGAMLSKHGDKTEAESLFVGALEILEKSLGRDHPGTSSTLNNLAELYSELGLLKQSESLYLRALAIRRKEPGDRYTDLLTTMNNLGATYVKMKKFSEAESLYREALELGKGSSDEPFSSSGTSVNGLRHLFRTEIGHYDSQEQYREAVAAGQKLLDLYRDPALMSYIENRPKSDNIAALLRRMAVLSVKGRDLENAVQLYEEALDVEIPEDMQWLTAELSWELARVHLDLGQYEQAVDRYRTVIELQSELSDPDEPGMWKAPYELALAISKLADIKLESGKTEEAVDLYIESIETFEGIDETVGPGLAIRMNNLAGHLVGLERYEEAEGYYIRALEILGPPTGEKHADYPLVMANLKQMYLIAGEAAKAAEIDSLMSSE